MFLNNLHYSGSPSSQPNFLIKGIHIQKMTIQCSQSKRPLPSLQQLFTLTDIIITGDNISMIQSTKAHLHKLFGIKDLGKSNYFLGFEVTYVDAGLVSSQHKFATDLLADSGITSFKNVVTPLPLNLKLQSNDSCLFYSPTLYRSIIGKLNFLINTRPNLSFFVQALSQFMQNSIKNHFKALTHILNYVAATSGQGILLKGSDSLKLQAFLATPQSTGSPKKTVYDF